MDDLMRLLEVARRELHADDARLELGGRDPGPEAVWCAVDDGYRLVLTFDGGAPQPPEVLCERLRMLATSFATTLQKLQRPRRRLGPQDSLDDALEVLAIQATARHAVVVDDDSPMIWGTNATPRGSEDLEDALRAAEALTLASATGIDLAGVLAGEVQEELPHELLHLLHRIREAAGTEEHRDREDWSRRLSVFAALVALRRMVDETPTSSRFSVRDPDLAFLARQFSGIYWLLLVFDDASFSELHAEAAMIHALPWIERLVEALPPVDPAGGGGRVVRLRQLRPV